MSLKSIEHMTSLSLDVDSFFCDMFGTIWDGYQFYETVSSVFKALKKSGKNIYILSNATALSTVFFKKTKMFGLEKGRDYDDFITSGDALKHLLGQGYFEKIANRKEFKFYVIGRPNPLLFSNISDKQTTDLKQAHLIYISGLDIDDQPPFTLDRFIPQAEQALQLKLPVVCANPDYIAYHGTDKYLTGGSLAKWYQDRGGIVHWVGKPYPYIFEYAFSRTKTSPEKAVMIGDTLRTDIAGGYHAGMKTVLLTKTGVTAEELQQTKSLEALCFKENVCPDFIMDSFK